MRFLVPLLLFGSTFHAQAQAYCVGHILHWSDGDTLSVACDTIGKTKIRLVGVDTPESRENQKLYRDLKRNSSLSKSQILSAGKKAKQFVEERCPSGTSAVIEIDTAPKDSYGRVLGFVFCNQTFINAALVKQGLAIPYSVSPNTFFAKEFENFAHEAADNQIGLWAEGIFQVSDINKNHKNGSWKKCK